MDTVIPEDVLELARPAIGKRVGELIEGAFKLAQYGGCPEILERAIDECSTRYFGDVQNHSPSMVEMMPSVPSTPGKNIVRTGALPTSPVLITGANKNRYGRKDGKPGYYSPHERVPAASYTELGRPVSRFHGVSYSGRISVPWVARYSGKVIARCTDEEEAARAYDLALTRVGKTPVNFPH